MGEEGGQGRLPPCPTSLPRLPCSPCLTGACHWAVISFQTIPPQGALTWTSYLWGAPVPSPGPLPTPVWELHPLLLCPGQHLGLSLLSPWCWALALSPGQSRTHTPPGRLPQMLFPHGGRSSCLALAQQVGPGMSRVHFLTQAGTALLQLPCPHPHWDLCARERGTWSWAGSR